MKKRNNQIRLSLSKLLHARLHILAAAFLEVEIANF